MFYCAYFMLRKPKWLRNVSIACKNETKKPQKSPKSIKQTKTPTTKSNQATNKQKQWIRNKRVSSCSLPHLTFGRHLVLADPSYAAHMKKGLSTNGLSLSLCKYSSIFSTEALQSFPGELPNIMFSPHTHKPLIDPTTHRSCFPCMFLSAAYFLLSHVTTYILSDSFTYYPLHWSLKYRSLCSACISAFQPMTRAGAQRATQMCILRRVKATKIFTTKVYT